MGRGVSVSFCHHTALPTLAQVGDDPGAPASSRRAARGLPGIEKDREIPVLTKTLGWGERGAVSKCRRGRVEPDQPLVPVALLLLLRSHPRSR